MVHGRSEMAGWRIAQRCNLGCAKEVLDSVPGSLEWFLLGNIPLCGNKHHVSVELRPAEALNPLDGSQVLAGYSSLVSAIDEEEAGNLQKVTKDIETSNDIGKVVLIVDIECTEAGRIYKDVLFVLDDGRAKMVVERTCQEFSNSTIRRMTKWM